MGSWYEPIHTYITRKRPGFTHAHSLLIMYLWKFSYIIISLGSVERNNVVSFCTRTYASECVKATVRCTQYSYIIIDLQTYRPVATGGARGAQPPLEKFEPPLGCPPWHFIGICIEVYSPPGILSAPPPTNDTWLRRCRHTHMQG